MRSTLLALCAALLLVACPSPPRAGQVAPPPPSSPPPPDPPPTPPPQSGDPLGKPTLTQADLEYAGSFAPPPEAVPDGKGGRWSTAYGNGGLALRRVGMDLRFFATTHVYSGGQVYEMGFPGLSSEPNKWPTAKIVREWGDVYGGRKTLLNSDKSGEPPCGGQDSTLGGGNWTHGLMWDDARGRLYWSYGHWYNVAGCNNPVLGYSTLEGGGAVAHGPWRSASPQKATSQMMRGGSLRIPGWFAQRFTGGRTLGLGFGGYYSGVAGASEGPALFAAADPQASSSTLEPLPLLAYPHAEPHTRWAKRTPDYFTDNVGWMHNPEGGVGFWTAADEIQGAAVWLDLPDKAGVLFLPRLGTGRIGYDAGAITQAGQQGWAYVYAPADLARVAGGEVQPWQVTPRSTFKMAYPKGAANERGDLPPAARATGAAFDPQTRTLYLYVLESRWEGVSLAPLIHAYRGK